MRYQALLQKGWLNKGRTKLDRFERWQNEDRGTFVSTVDGLLHSEMQRFERRNREEAAIQFLASAPTWAACAWNRGCRAGWGAGVIDRVPVAPAHRALFFSIANVVRDTVSTVVVQVTWR